MQSLPEDPDELWVAIEPMLATLSTAKKPDFATLRRTLPAAGRTAQEARALVVEDAQIVTGSLIVEDGLALRENAMLVVLGDLTVRGGLWSPPHQFSLVLVGGTLDLDRAHTSGEALVFGGITAQLWWGVGNDHSTYAPALISDIYIASEDRGDIVSKVTAKTTIVGFDVSAKIAKAFPKLDAADPEALRALIGGAAPAKPRTARAKTSELEALRAELAAAWALVEHDDGARIAKVKVLRKIYATIAKRRLAEAGPLLVEMMAHKRAATSWSLQDELELLARLGRADLIEALSEAELGGYANWRAHYLAQARKT